MDALDEWHNAAVAVVHCKWGSVCYTCVFPSLCLKLPPRWFDCIREWRQRIGLTRGEGEIACTNTMDSWPNRWQWAVQVLEHWRRQRRAGTIDNWFQKWSSIPEQYATERGRVKGICPPMIDKLDGKQDGPACGCCISAWIGQVTTTIWPGMGRLSVLISSLKVIHSTIA